jgi:hypothetical protein
MHQPLMLPLFMHPDPLLRATPTPHSPLQYVAAEFLPSLASSEDPDVRAVHMRIATYIRMKRFLQPPEGRAMPQFDASSIDRA